MCSSGLVVENIAALPYSSGFAVRFVCNYDAKVPHCSASLFLTPISPAIMLFSVHRFALFTSDMNRLKKHTASVSPVSLQSLDAYCFSTEDKEREQVVQSDSYISMGFSTLNQAY
jgi:hypothetical protein